MKNKETVMREFLINKPFEIANKLNSIVSLSIVGSFSEHNDLTGISDIDTVVIVDHLDQWTFREIISEFEKIAIPLKEKFNFGLKINNTFGPLKYNEDKTVVYHLMIYDIAGHIDHCRKSPFTCYDWQRTKIFCKKHLSEIYSVRTLMPHYFFNARRGVKEYLSDFDKSEVSYRCYHFEDGLPIQIKKQKKMTNKDRFEFAYHIMKFVMTNYLKMINQENVKYDEKFLLEHFLKLIPTLDLDFTQKYLKIKEFKIKNKFPECDQEIQELNWFVHDFLDNFEKGFNSSFQVEKSEIIFTRHEKTSLNKNGVFLGQGLNPSIIKNRVSTKKRFDLVFSSPLKRCVETANLLCLYDEINLNDLLKEIDYGKAESKNLSWLRQNYPEIINCWQKGFDPHFPDGENQSDVTSRLELFIDKLLLDCIGMSVCVVTHNVWLRCLIGKSLNISPEKWFKIEIPHAEFIKFRISPTNKIIPDFSITQQCNFLKNIEKEDFLDLQTSKDNKVAQRDLFWKEVYAKRFLTLNKSVSGYYDGTCLIPMAGEGRRFQDYGFNTPKPLLRFEKQTMISKVVKDLPKMKKIIYMARSSHITGNLSSALKETAPEVEIIPIEELTQGQASTCLLGINSVDLTKPLLIAPCDNGMNWDHFKYQSLIESDTDLVCWTFTKHLAISDSPHSWGYALSDEDENILKVSVKKPMTDDPYTENCIVGTFWFKNGRLFKELAEELIHKDIRVNGEYYVDSIVQLAVEKKLIVKNFTVDNYISWGKPHDLFEYQKWMNLQSLYDVKGSINESN